MPERDCDIALLVPDLPDAEALLPWLKRIDAARWYTNGGPLLREWEALLVAAWPAPSCNVNTVPSALNVVSLNNGTSALELAIMALQLPRGGSVLLPSFTFPATASASLRGGLAPVFSDVSASRWQLEPDMARTIAAQRALALVMPVATFGCPVDVAAWDAFSADTGIPVLIDAAGAFGQQAVGEHTHLAFSLHATKPFGIGEGGLLATRNRAFAERVRRLANFGFDAGRVETWGSNGKPSEYAAAVALAQWQRWPQVQAVRRRQWQHYLPLLHGLPGITLQEGFSPASKALADDAVLPANIVVQLPVPAAPVRTTLAQAGIETRAWYCPPLHRQPASAACALANDELAISDHLASHSLGLPWHTRLLEADMARVAQALREHS